MPDLTKLIKFEYRGSWFAEIPGIFEEKLPVMWDYNCNWKNKELLTNWLNKGLNGSKNLSKYQKFSDFFKEKINNDIPVVIAIPVDKNKHPHEVKSYKGVYKVKIIKNSPEIKLQILEFLN